MVANEQVLRSVEGLFDSSADVSREEFRTFVAAQHLEKELSRYPGGRLLAADPSGRTSLPMWQEFVAKVSRATNSVRPAHATSIRRSSTWNLSTGVISAPSDTTCIPSRCAARRCSRAAETGAAALSGKVILVQETDKDVQAGVLLYLPIYSRTARRTNGNA
jgi:hypothetical protein